MGWGFYAALIIVAAFGFLIWRLMQRSGDAAAMEEREAWQRGQVKAAREAAETDRETLGRMADADAASVHDTADAARQRMRDRNPKTR